MTQDSSAPLKAVRDHPCNRSYEEDFLKMTYKTLTTALTGRVALIVAALALLALAAVSLASVAYAQSPSPAPTGLTASASSGGITLSWTAPDAGGVTGYQILRRLRAEGWVWSQAVYVDDTGSTATSYTDADVQAGEEYHYRVKARYGSVIGRWSNGVNVRAAASAPEPPPSTDATLSALTLSGVNFGTFDSATTGYTASVGNDMTETTVTPTANDGGATYVVKLGGVEDADGTVDLAVGANTITVEVTAEDGNTAKTYTVTVTRAAPPSDDATLSGLTLSGINFGTFDSPTTEYTASVGNDVTETTVTPTANDGEATYAVKLGGVEDADRTVALAVGANVITVEVTAEDGQTTKTYRVTVTRAAAVPPQQSGLTAEFQEAPETHDGTNPFTFRIAFSEPISVSFVTVRDHALEVKGGSVTGAWRVDSRNDLWGIRMQPDSDADVEIALPANRACDTQGAVCTADEKVLSNRPEMTIPGPAPVNSPATGAPTISGTAQVGQTLTASTSGIADADGLSNAAFSYQWIASDGTTDTDISGATSSTYTLLAADEGNTIKVRVTFTDDASNEESLTSAATAAVAAQEAAEPSVTSVTLKDVWIDMADVTVNVSGANGSEIHLRYRKGNDDWTTESKAVAPGESSVEFRWNGLTGARTYTVEASYDSTFATGKQTITFTTDTPTILSSLSGYTTETTATVRIMVFASNGDDVYLRYRPVGGDWSTTISKAANPDPAYHSGYVPFWWTLFGIALTGLTASTDYEVQVSFDSTFPDPGSNGNPMFTTGPFSPTDTFTFTSRGITVSVDTITQTTAMVTVKGIGLDGIGHFIHLRFRTGSGAWTVDSVRIPVNRDSVRFQLARLPPGTTWELEVSYDSDFRATSTKSTTFTTSSPPSDDATLSGLTLSGVNFGTFSSATTDYTANVSHDVTETTVTPTANDGGATYAVKLGGVVDADGTVALAVGANTVSVVVTAEDGQTTKTYTVTVTRAEAEEEAEPDTPLTAPDTPTGEVTAKGQVKLDWNDVEGATGYRVQFYVSMTTGWVDLPTDDIGIAYDGSSATVSGLPDYDLYYFRVSTSHSDWWSDYLTLENPYN